MHCLQTLARQLAEVKDSLQFSNKTCEQLETRAEEIEKANATLTKQCESQQTQLEQKTAALQDMEEKLECVQRECQQMKKDHSETLSRSCSNGIPSGRKKTASGGDDSVDHPTATGGTQELKKTVEELMERLRTTNYQRQKYEKGLREVLSENQSLSRQLERAESDLGELQARLRAYEDAMERQSLERSCNSPLVHSGQYHHPSVSSTPTYSSMFHYTSSLPSPSGGGGGDDTGSQHSLKTSRTTDSLLGTSLFSELDSQYSDLQVHYDELVQQCTCSAGLVHRNRMKQAPSETSGPDSLSSLVTPPLGADSSVQPFKDLFEEVFATLKQTAAVADKLVQRKKAGKV